MAAAPTVTAHQTTRRITLSQDRSERLHSLARSRQASEDELIERALDLYFQLVDFFDEPDERHLWQRLSESSLQRVWDNEQDAAYDDSSPVLHDPRQRIRIASPRLVHPHQIADFKKEIVE